MKYYEIYFYNEKTENEYFLYGNFNNYSEALKYAEQEAMKEHEFTIGEYNSKEDYENNF